MTSTSASRAFARHRGREVLVDDSLDTVELAGAVANHRYAAAPRRDDEVARVEQGRDRPGLEHLERLR